jgi:Spy/CpxP family protein refolding chaperone
MKKFLFLTLIFCAAISTNIYAQAGDPPSLLDQMKEKLSPQMVEKTGLTRAQADKVIEINYDMRQALSVALKDLNETDRAAKIAEFKAGRDKKYSEIPLTEEQIAAVKSFYENMGKNMSQKKD